VPQAAPVGEVVEVNNDGFRCEFSQRLAVGTKLYTFPPAAQPVQEPVAWGVFEGNLHDMFFTQEQALDMADLKGTHAEVRPLYTAPPAAQRPWQGLTEDEIKGTWAQLWYDLTHGKLSTPDNEVRNNVVMFGQALEAKLKEKNNG
jgi:hypothetical protein